MKFWGRVSGILGQMVYLAAFMALSIILLPVLAVTSNIYVVGFGFNPLAEPLLVALVALIALLLAANGAVLLHNLRAGAVQAHPAAFFGAAASFLTSACFVCQPAIFLWLGAGTATAFLADSGVYVAGASVALLSLSLYSMATKGDACGVRKNGNGD